MTVDEFRSAGERLFGDGWQRQLAEYFDINLDNVRQWASGKRPIPQWMATELCGVRMLLLLPELIDILDGYLVLAEDPEAKRILDELRVIEAYLNR